VRNKRLGKGLKKDYREGLIRKDTDKSDNLDTQTSRNSEIKTSRKQTTIYLTKEQFRAIKEIQLQLLDDDFKIENSEIAGLGIELLKEILKNPNVQKARSLERLKSKCQDFLTKIQNI